MLYRFDVCHSLPACSVSAEISAECAWPSAFTAIPAPKSRNRRPSASTSQLPSPLTKVSGARLYVGRTDGNMWVSFIKKPFECLRGAGKSMFQEGERRKDRKIANEDVRRVSVLVGSWNMCLVRS